MPRFLHLAPSLSLVVGLGLCPQVLRAAEPSDATDDPPSPLDDAHWRMELAGGVAFGNADIATGESLNSYGPTASIRVGYTFAFPIYLGLRYDHFFGSSAQYPVPLLARVEYHLGAHFVGANAGAELRIGPAFLRPQLGVGLLALRSSASCSAASGSFSDLSAQTCHDLEQSSTSWAAAVVPGVPMGLHFGRFFAFVEPSYYVRKTAGAYALVGAVGLGF